MPLGGATGDAAGAQSDAPQTDEQEESYIEGRYEDGHTLAEGD